MKREIELEKKTYCTMWVFFCMNIEMALISRIIYRKCDKISITTEFTECDIKYEKYLYGVFFLNLFICTKSKQKLLKLICY